MYVFDTFAIIVYFLAEPGGEKIAEYTISYADAFAASLAQELDASLVTGDSEFKAIKEKLSILWLDK
jgi:predicted nucleic acid-binding protein